MVVVVLMVVCWLLWVGPEQPLNFFREEMRGEGGEGEGEP